MIMRKYSEYEILDFMWHTARDYMPIQTALDPVCGILIGELEEIGLVGEVVAKEKASRIIQVGEHQFRVYYRDKFVPYDVRIVK